MTTNIVITSFSK